MPDDDPLEALAKGAVKGFFEHWEEKLPGWLSRIQNHELAFLQDNGADDAYAESLPLTNPGKVGNRFSETAITGAIAATQRKAIDYQEFLRRLIAGGCVYYAIFMKGRKMAYVGSLGESHEEDFPEQLIRYLES